MSRLEFYSRPLVAFDPTNKDHRRWYYEFVKNRTWGGCPVRFICPDATGFDLVSMLKNELIDWYIHKEFKPKKVVQKRKKTVDKQPKR